MDLSDPPIFDGPPRVFPKFSSMTTFRGLSRDLLETFGEEKPLIGFFSQILPYITYYSHTNVCMYHACVCMYVCMYVCMDV